SHHTDVTDLHADRPDQSALARPSNTPNTACPRATRSRIKTRIDWRYCMPRLPALLGSVLALGFAACRGDAPTAPRNLAAPDTTQGGIAAGDLAGLVDALADLRTRILPALGDGPETQTLDDALDTLGRPLAPA